MDNRVAIIGGGFSGTVLAAELLKTSEEPLDILWFERSGAFGAGLAYGTDEPSHLLNVPAGKMSAIADSPSHFADWLVSRQIVGPEVVEHFFAPRRVYRVYLQELINEARENPKHHASSLTQIAEEVVSVSEGSIVTKSGHKHQVGKAVLATGYLPESSLSSELPTAFRSDQWLTSDVREIVLIGSGLTAIDAALSAFERYPRVRITAISRHGKIPSRFEFTSTFEPSSPPPMSCSRMALKWLRKEATVAGWHEVFSYMRPKWDSLWLNSSPEQQRQFLRHLRHRFDPLRHRIPPSSADKIASYQQEGRFKVLCGTVVSADENTVNYTFGGVDGILAGDLVIDCSGQSLNWERSQDALVSSLISSGKVLPGPHGTGIEVSLNLLVQDERGSSTWLYAVGPILRGQHWETTAVAEIRNQISTLKRELLGG